MRKRLTTIAAAATIAVLAGCVAAAFAASRSANVRSTSSSSSRHPVATIARNAKASRAVKISTKTVHGLGKILVNAKGRTLYTFAPDKHSKVTCKGECSVIWPPAYLGAGEKATASGGVKQHLLGSDADGGKRVITYDHWPLYTYVTDTKTGQATGQGLNLNGGLWYVISPSGKVIKKKA